MSQAKKIVMIGDSNVGKTSIIQRYVNKTFDTGGNAKATMGAAFKLKDVICNEETGDTVRLQIWDTAGQEKYNSLTKLYFKGVWAAIIVYDISDYSSFVKAQKWVDELKEVQNED